MIGLSAVHSTPEEFENMVYFFRLDLPSTLIRHENGASQKCSSNGRIFETLNLRFRVDEKQFENRGFRKQWHSR